ncbi:MAG TPA: dTDP-glucose 4,6-dehydratase, partial [Myxococcales bacterium]|nr:dTDP-glucose 4,6-dehydratase [Myxococcales bacterium]
MDTILVTGGCGFIGSNFIRHVLQEQLVAKLINVDLLTYAGNPANLADFEDDERYVFYRADIADEEAINEILSTHQVDVLLNFAAESHVDRSIVDPQAFVRTNLVGTSTLLNAARKQNVPRYIQISTDEVYGSLSFDDPAFTEQTALNPRNPYSAAKAGGDMLVLAHEHTFGINACVTRCSNNYGPYQFPEKLIPLMLLNAMDGKPLPVYGTGENIRDWIHVEDHCRGIAAVLQHGQTGRVYHFGGDCELQNIDVVRRIIEAAGASEEQITYVKDRPGHDMRYAMNFEETTKELGWT